MPIKRYAIKLEAIRIFLSRAFNVHDEYTRVLDKEYTEDEWDVYGEAEHDRAVDALLAYQEIVTRSVLGELNALVEYELKWVAKSIQRKHVEESQSESRRLSRGEARQIIEKEYDIDLSSLPGFLEVNEVRSIANAYKHDDGYSDEYEPFFSDFYLKRKYEINPDEAVQYLDAVRGFLSALPGEKSNLGEDVRIKKFAENL